MIRVGLKIIPLLAAVLLAGSTWIGHVYGQVIIPNRPVTAGVSIDAEGVISHRADDPVNQLANMRKRFNDANNAKAPSSLKCVSLPKLFAQAQELIAAKKDLPEEIRYLGGLTRIDYVFVYPEQKDLLIAGPAEEWVGGDTLEPTGKVTGRPVMQFYDLVVVMRTVATRGNGNAFFGCSIDMPANSGKISDDIAKKYGARPAAEIVAAMKKAMGPQKIVIYGTAEDTRVALAMVAADYKLKRMSMGLEVTPVEGIGHAVDDSRVAGCRFWFEPMYDPLMVSDDGLSYGIKGQRVQVMSGTQLFDTKGTTEKAKQFATKYTKKVPELAKAQPALADLQNVADLALVSALIRHDGLDKKVGWDYSWCLSKESCAVPALPSPKSCETVVAVVGNAVASGGVGFNFGPWVGAQARVSAKEGALPAAPKVPAEKSWQSTLQLPAAAGTVKKP